MSRITGAYTFTPLSSFNPNEGVEKLFDGNLGTKCMANLPSWVDTFYVVIDTGENSKIFLSENYKLGSANDAPERDPKGWEISGSNDNLTWQILAQVKNQDKFSQRNTLYDFSFTSPQVEGYRYFKFEVIQRHNATIPVQLSELQLFSNPNPLSYKSKGTGGLTAKFSDGEVHTFLENGTFKIKQSVIADVLVVGGGGGGGGAIGGGGGGAQAVIKNNLHLRAGTYQITVGEGGNGGLSVGLASSVLGLNGASSSLGNLITALGGGGGSAYTNSVSDTPLTPPSGAWAGGGGGMSNQVVGAGGVGVGFNGGTGGVSEFYKGGGGGGASGHGNNFNDPEYSNGGAGIQSDISGFMQSYAGGGGGGCNSHTPAYCRGRDGGGNGGRYGSMPAQPGRAGSGAGGGGGMFHETTSNNKGGKGGNGVVIIKIKSIAGGALAFKKMLMATM